MLKPAAPTRYNAAVAEAPERPFTLRQRIALWAIANIGALAIWLIGPTLRYEEHFEDDWQGDFRYPAIYPFWHRGVFPAVYWFRNRNIAVMTSRSFDGEYIARIIEKFGFRAVRGSSSRGAVAALIGMKRELEQGRAVAFTIDGPRGPRFIAKPGPVLLARKTGQRIIPLHLQPARHWTLKSWDAFMIPKPFSRVLVTMGHPIHVPPDGDEAQAHLAMQQGLERIQHWSEREAYGPKYPVPGS